jgi:riboflavin kinase/FMN adenylyltransferase
MKVVRSLTTEEELFESGFVTLGNFDGVHLGHQAILKRLAALAREAGGTSILVTFDPHPVTVLAPHKAPAQLTTTDEKLRRLEGCGLDAVVVIPFNEAFAAVEAEDFIEEILIGMLDVTHLVVGPDCRFGKNRRGSRAMLDAFGRDQDFTVEGIEPIISMEEKISSSRIRGAIAQGNVHEASLMLGHLHLLEGVVIEGDKRGRTIGFPTANVSPADRMLIPARGVYRGFVQQGSSRLPAVINIGVRPTFDNDNLSVEAHILHFDGDLYGQNIGIEFAERIRDEMKFDSVEALKQQITEDVEQAQIAFSDER